MSSPLSISKQGIAMSGSLAIAILIAFYGRPGLTLKADFPSPLAEAAAPPQHTTRA